MITDAQMGIAIVALGSVIAVNALEIGLRFFLGRSLFWIQDVSLLLMLWMIFPGVAKIVYDKKDIVVTMLIDKLPPRPKALVDIIGDLLIIVFALILTIFSYRLLLRQSGSSTATVRIPLFFYTSAVVLNSATILAIYLNEVVIKLRRAVQNREAV
jgi:TRAP-type C4-dicarboxylate transport system permease small subunit